MFGTKFGALNKYGVITGKVRITLSTKIENKK